MGRFGLTSEKMSMVFSNIQIYKESDTQILQLVGRVSIPVIQHTNFAFCYLSSYKLGDLAFYILLLAK